MARKSDLRRAKRIFTLENVSSLALRSERLVEPSIVEDGGAEDGGAVDGVVEDGGVLDGGAVDGVVVVEGFAERAVEGVVVNFLAMCV